MNNLIIPILKFIMGMKIGTAIALIGGGLVLITLIRNILIGTFNVSKFAGGFNIFSGSIQGKLIYWGILAILAFGLYHQLTRSTFNYDTDYRNNIRNNRDVYLDQRVGDVCTEKCVLSIQPLGFTILKFGCVKSCESSITQKTKVETSKELPKITETKIIKLNPLFAPFRWIRKIFKK